MSRKELLEKYKDIIPYLFFGVCTTAVNMIGYWTLAYLCDFGMMPSTVIAWLLALIFAYVTNRKWVFKSEAKNPGRNSKRSILFLYLPIEHRCC